MTCKYCEETKGRGKSRHRVPVQIPFWREGESASADFEVIPGAYSMHSKLEFNVRVLGEWVNADAEINFCPMCGRDLRGDAGAQDAEMLHG